MKVYDGPYCIRDPDYYWKGRIREFDVSVGKSDELNRSVDTIFEKVTAHLVSRGANFVDSSAGVSNKRVGPITEEEIGAKRR